MLTRTLAGAALLLAASCADLFPGSPQYVQPLVDGVFLAEFDGPYPPGIWPVVLTESTRRPREDDETVRDDVADADNPYRFVRTFNYQPRVVLSWVGDDTVVGLPDPRWSGPVLADVEEVYRRAGHPDVRHYSGQLSVPLGSQNNAIGWELHRLHLYELVGHATSGLRATYWCVYHDAGSWSCETWERAALREDMFRCWRIVSETGRYADSVPREEGCAATLRPSVGTAAGYGGGPGGRLLVPAWGAPE